MTLYTLDTQMP